MLYEDTPLKYVVSDMRIKDLNTAQSKAQHSEQPAESLVQGYAQKYFAWYPAR